MTVPFYEEGYKFFCCEIIFFHLETRKLEQPNKKIPYLMS